VAAKAAAAGIIAQSIDEFSVFSSGRNDRTARFHRSIQSDASCIICNAVPYHMLYVRVTHILSTPYSTRFPSSCSFSFLFAAFSDEQRLGSAFGFYTFNPRTA